MSLKHNNGVANNLPGDLFYGQIVLHRSSTKATSQELKIERKVSSMSILTKGALNLTPKKAIIITKSKEQKAHSTAMVN